MVKMAFVNIKNVDKIFDEKEITSDLFGEEVAVIQKNCIMKDYINEKLEILKTDKTIDSYNYLGERGRISKFEYELEANGNVIKLSATLDTFDSKHYLEIEMNSSVSTDYDYDFEKLKLAIKKLMIKDWKKCIWLRDEQSEELASKLYAKTHIVENQLRELINKVLTKELGTTWLDMDEFHKIKSEYNSRSVDFKRIVENFNNIDDSLISINTDSLVKIMKTVVFENEIDINATVQSNIRLKSKILELDQKLFDSLKHLWKVKIDLWNDVFVKLFDKSFDLEISNFIKNRNHIAHNKLLDYSSFQKIESNIDKMKIAFEQAIVKIDQNYLSDEAIMTLEAEEEQKREEENYLLDLKMSEAGINILNYDSIYRKFAQSIQEVYISINDEFYFNDWIHVSAISMSDNTGNEQAVFSISNNISVDDTLVVYASYSIDDGEGELSSLDIKVKNNETVIFETTIEYINGEAHYYEDGCYYLPATEDEYNNDGQKEFISDLNEYIREDMNKIKREVDSLSSCISPEELGPTVSQSPCYSCGEEYISVNDEIYPFGKCINCGEENELKECIRCHEIFNSEVEGAGELCDNCHDFIENE